MKTFIVTNKISGVEVTRYQNDIAIEWPGMEFSDFYHTEYNDPTIVEEPIIQPRMISKLSFVGLLGNDYAAIFTAAKSNVHVEYFVKMIDWATTDANGNSIDLNDPRVSMGLNMMESAGLIAEGRAQEILNG